MSTAAVSFPPRFIRCNYRPLLLTVAGVVLSTVFRFTSRDPQLLHKAAHIGSALPAMAYSTDLFTVTAATPVWQKIPCGAVNWLAGMKTGMTFGVLLGALLHTVLRYYPLKIGSNLSLNSLKGALAGVCANCSVPVACGITRGKGRVEVALGFLFRSPNFNPVVVAMTFAAMLLRQGVPTGYVMLFAMTLGTFSIVPGVYLWRDVSRPLAVILFVFFVIVGWITGMIFY